MSGTCLENHTCLISSSLTSFIFGLSRLLTGQEIFNLARQHISILRRHYVILNKLYMQKL